MFEVARDKRTFDCSAKQLAAFLYKFLQQNRSSRIMQRNNVENYSSVFDWETLIKHFESAYQLALQR
jgi:glycogen synthase